jgi:hypothetical protein
VRNPTYVSVSAGIEERIKIGGNTGPGVSPTGTSTYLGAQILTRIEKTTRSRNLR